MQYSDGWQSFSELIDIDLRSWHESLISIFTYYSFTSYFDSIVTSQFKVLSRFPTPSWWKLTEIVSFYYWFLVQLIEGDGGCLILPQAGELHSVIPLAPRFLNSRVSHSLRSAVHSLLSFLLTTLVFLLTTLSLPLPIHALSFLPHYTRSSPNNTRCVSLSDTNGPG
jgi:hypothetical protein